MSQKLRLVIVVAAVAAAAAALLLTRPQKRGGGLTAAFDAEFLTRPDGYPGLRERYGLSFPEAPLQMDPGLMYQAVADGSVDVIDGFATDGRIPAYGLVTLEDDRRFFPPYEAAPVVREATRTEYPGLAPALGALAGRIDDATMQALNYRVDEQGERAADVARGFLADLGLLAPVPRRPEARPVAVGSKHFTEQEVVGEMMAILIEENLGLPVERRLNMGGTMICFNALRSGDIDLYAEYTGTGLVNILREETVLEPAAALRAVRERFAADYELVWLEPFGFNNTYTLTMTRRQAGELGIASISDLAAYLRGR